MATIEKRNNKYTVRYSVYDETGKRRQKRKTFNSSTAAKKFKIEIEKQLLDNTYIEETKDTLSQYLHDWLESRKNQIAPNTYRGYKKNIEHITKIIGNKNLQKLTPVHIRKAYEELLTELSSTSVLYIHRTLNKALKDAVRDQLISRNPCEFVEAPKKDPTFEACFLHPDEIPELLNAFKNHDLYLAVALGVLRGLRRNEILALTWQDIDLRANIIHVRHNINWNGDSYSLDRPKSKKSIRTVPISNKLKELFKEQKRRQIEYKQKFWNKYYKSDFVITYKDGTLIKPATFSKTFARELKNNGLRHVRFHDLRHTAASLMLIEGVQLKVVSEILGHSTVSITADLYSHVIDELKREASLKLDSKYL